MDNKELVLCVPCKELPKEWLQKKVCIPLDESSLKTTLTWEKCQFRDKNDVMNDSSMKQIKPYIWVCDSEDRYLSYVCQGLDTRECPLWTVGIGCDVRKEDIEEGGDIFNGFIKGMKRFCQDSIGEECGDMKFVGLVHDAARIMKNRHDDDFDLMAESSKNSMKSRQAPLEIVFTTHVKNGTVNSIHPQAICEIKAYFFSKEITSLLNAETRSKLALKLVGIGERQKGGRKTAVVDVYCPEKNKWFNSGPDEVRLLTEEEQKEYEAGRKSHILTGARLSCDKDSLSTKPYYGMSEGIFCSSRQEELSVQVREHWKRRHLPTMLAFLRSGCPAFQICYSISSLSGIRQEEYGLAGSVPGMLRIMIRWFS